MSENNFPWELRNLTLSPGLHALQESKTRINKIDTHIKAFENTPKIIDFTQQAEQIRAASQGIVTHLTTIKPYIHNINEQFPPMIEAVGSTMKSFTAIQSAADSISKFNNYDYTGAMKLSIEAINNMTREIKSQQLIDVQNAAETIAQTITRVSSYNFASSFNSSDFTFDESLVDVPVQVDPYEELSQKEIHEELQKQIEIDNEILGEEVPYNVLSNDFIVNVYLPVSGMVDTIKSAETFDSTFAARFILFSLLPLIYYLITKKDESK